MGMGPAIAFNSFKSLSHALHFQPMPGHLIFQAGDSGHQVGIVHWITVGAACARAQARRRSSQSTKSF